MRELENAIERAVVLSTGAEIGPTICRFSGASPATRPSGDRPAPTTRPCWQFKREFLRSALAQAKGNQTRAAEALGLQRTYLSRLLKDLGVRDA